MGYRDFARIGWRARIGVVAPATGMPHIADFNKVAPEGVAVVVTTPSRPLREDTVEELTSIGEYVPDAAKHLARVKPDVIAWMCTTGSLIRGIGYDQELIKRIEEATGIPATTTSTAVVAALRKLGIRKLCVAMPYIDEVNKVAKKFLEDSGFEVLRYKGLQILNAVEIIETPPFVMYKLAKEVDLPEADGIFISCTGLNVLDIIEKLEQDLGKPVVTSNQASFWHAFQIAKVGEPIQGYGRLLREPR